MLISEQTARDEFSPEYVLFAKKPQYCHWPGKRIETYIKFDFTQSRNIRAISFTKFLIFKTFNG